MGAQVPIVQDLLVLLTRGNLVLHFLGGCLFLGFRVFRVCCTFLQLRRWLREGLSEAFMRAYG